MTDSANFQSQMSEIWKARREREMYRLDLEKELFIKKQHREKRRDELRSKVKALHDDLVREDITSSQRVKMLLSKVESLKNEHQVLAAHTERLKLKKRQIELQLVTSYPIIHQAVQQEIRNSNLTMGLSQVSHPPIHQNAQSSGQPQPQQLSTQPYNVMQLGGVGETGYRGIPGIISTVNAEMNNHMLMPPGRERLENQTEANMTASNKNDKPDKLEDQRNESIQKYLSSLENRIYSNPAQSYNSPIASNYQFPVNEQIPNHQFNHSHPATQGGINRNNVQSPSLYSNQRGNSNYSPKQLPGQRLNSHQEENVEIQQQRKPDIEIEYAESVGTAHNTNVRKANMNYENTNQSYHLENDQRSLNQSQYSEQYSTIKEDEDIIRRKQYAQNPPRNIEHSVENENQSHGNTYYHNEGSYDNGSHHYNAGNNDYHSNEESQNYRENMTDSQNYAGPIAHSQDYGESVAGSQNHIDIKSNSENYVENTADLQYHEENLSDSQNYRDKVTDSQHYMEDAINSQNERESLTDSQNHREYVSDSQNYRDNVSDSQYYREEVSDSQNYRENMKDFQNNRENIQDSSVKSNTQQDYSQAEHVEEYSQESCDTRNQPMENHSNMEYQVNTVKDYDEYGNQDSASCVNEYENPTVDNIKDKLVEQSSIQSSLNKDNNIYDEEDSDFFERAGPATSSAAYQNLLGVAAPSLGIESDSDEMEGQMAAMALKKKPHNAGPPSFKTFASTIPSLRPSAALTDSDSVDSVEAAIQAAMNKKADQGTGKSDSQSSEAKANLSESSKPVPVSTAKPNFSTQPSTVKPKPGNTALQLNLSDDESYNVSGGANDSYDEDDDDFFD